MNKLYKKLAIALFLIIAGYNSSNAQSGAYGVSPFNDSIYSMDTTGFDFTKTSSIAGNLPGHTVTGFTGLAVHPSTSETYAIAKVSGIIGRVLCKVNVVTGLLDSILNTGDNVANFDFINDTILVAYTGDGATTSETMLKINLITGTITTIGSSAAGSDGESMTYCPDDNKVYRWSGRDTNPAMEKWDVASGTFTTVNRTGFNYDEVMGSTYLGNYKFLLTNIDNEYIVVDTSGFAVDTTITPIFELLKGTIFTGRSIGAITAIDCDTSLLRASLGDNYQWYLNGTAIVGANSQEYTATLSGHYNCTIEITGALTAIDTAFTGIDIINLPFATTLNQTLCNGDSIVINGTTYNSTVTGATEIFTNIGTFGCDSTVTINLTVLNLTGTVNQTICAGDSIVINGTTYNSTVTGATEIFTNIGSYSCDSTVTINLTVEAPIDVTVTNSSPLLTSNATGATYQWLDCDNGNAVIAGATNASYTATVNGNYAVEATVNNCVDTSACENVSSVGINNLTNSSFSIYPNPVADLLTVDFGKNITDLTIKIVSVDGKVVYTNNIILENKLTINSENWSKGLYIITISNNKDITTLKLIKE